MPTEKQNIWVAASDGDLARVKELIEQHGMSPNSFDDNTYSPMHAATSYGHLDILDYLLAQGGDINLSDGDGDTPIYCCESIEVARYLVDRGAVVDMHNHEGVSPIQWIAEDHPEVAQYLQTRSKEAPTALAVPNAAGPTLATALATALAGASEGDLTSTDARSIALSALQGMEPELMQLASQHGLSQYSQNQVADAMSAELAIAVEDLMTRASAGEPGFDLEQELARVVLDVVVRCMSTGLAFSQDSSAHDGQGDAKRGRVE